MSDAVDTEVSDYEDVAVMDTPEWDNPKFGSVSIVFQQTRSSQHTQRISRATALKLRDQLNRYLD